MGSDWAIFPNSIWSLIIPSYVLINIRDQVCFVLNDEIILSQPQFGLLV